MYLCPNLPVRIKYFNQLNTNAYSIFIFPFFLLLLPACRHKGECVPPRAAFYHWQTRLRLAPSQRQLMDSINAKKLYVKFFDIDLDKNGQPAPRAVVQLDTHLLQNITIVPTVFITNRTFKKNSKKNIEILAENIFFKIKQIMAGAYPPLEIQFDCDWTASTRDPYFYFLQYAATLSEAPVLSTTIRLHQYKYPGQTGVPPVDRGMLMFYNMGEVDEWETGNSILDTTIAKKYLSPEQPYPLPLDVALPLFRWGAVFRNGRLAYLINDLGEEQLTDTARFVAMAPHRYGVGKSTYLNGYYLYAGDRIRLEGISPGLLQKAAALLAPVVKKTAKPHSLTVSFYHLGTAARREMKPMDFRKVMKKFCLNHGDF